MRLQAKFDLDHSWERNWLIRNAEVALIPTGRVDRTWNPRHEKIGTKLLGPFLSHKCLGVGFDNILLRFNNLAPSDMGDNTAVAKCQFECNSLSFLDTESDAGEIGARATGGVRSSGNLFRRPNSWKETGS